MKFILGYRTELFIIFLVPIHPLRWYRFLRYSGTGSSAMMVPIRALRWYRLTDTITLSQGLYKEYQRNEYNDSHVRGTVDLNRHIRKNVPFCGRIAYQTREFCYDNHITQLIRHTIEYIRTKHVGEYLLHQSADIQQGVSMIVSATPKYRRQDRQKVIQSNLKPLHHPYFTRYTALQTLCLQILRHEQLKYGKCDNEVYGILFDVSWLWEEYLATILTKHGFKHPNNKWRSNGIYMGYNINNKRKNAFLRYPDFYDKEKNGSVVDAK